MSWRSVIKEEDHQVTALTMGNMGLHECSRMTFGLTNALATFQPKMGRCIGHLNLKEYFFSLMFSETF